MNNSRRIVQLLGLWMMFGATTVFAQYPYSVETRPPRGFMPGADQLTSPVDSIDPISGKLHLEIPIASLPRGRAGSGFDLNLVYDSHLYDLVPEILQPPNSTLDPEVAWLLSSYSTGGWHYNIDNLHLDIEGHYGAVDNVLDCAEDSPRRVYRLRVPMFDGSLHIMQLRGYGAAVSDNYSGDGFFGIYPLTGRANVCAAKYHEWPSQLTGWLSYYSIDGSYLKLEVYVDGSGNMDAAPFYIYYPDGQRATGHGFFIENLFDANGNGIHFSNHCADDPCNFTYTAISDDAGHEIRIVQNGTLQDRTDSVSVEGPNGVETTTVNWMMISIGSQNNRTYWWSEASWNHTYPLFQMMNVVKYVQLPLLQAVASNDNPPVWNSYAFGYADDADGGYGEVDSMRTPTGALFQYRYMFEGGVQDAMTIAGANPVRERKVTHDGISDLIWTYNGGIITNPDGSVTQYFASNNLGGPYSAGYQDSGILGTFQSPVVYRIEEPDGTVRKRVWSQNIVPGTVNQFSLAPVPVQNPWIRRETSTIGDASGHPSLTSVVDRMIDKNGNLLQTTEYDWVNYNPGGPETGIVPRRITQLHYYADVPDATAISSSANAYWNPHTPGRARRLDAVQRKEISDGSGVKAAVTEFVYDDAFGAGNITSELHWDSVKSASVPVLGMLSSANSQILTRSYDGYGNITDFFEPEIRTHITYDGTGSVPVQVDYAYQTSQQRSWQYNWNVSSGTLTSKTDLDNNITTSYSYDTVGRPLIVSEAGTRKTETVYDDANLRITVRKDLNSYGDGKLQVTTQYDQLGRSVLARSSEPGNADGIKTKSAYYPLVNRTVRSSPYRTLSDPTLEWSCVQTDSSKRVIAVAIFKGSEPTDCASSTNRTAITSTDYNVNQTTVTDPASKQNTQILDGLGRLVNVVEDPSGLHYITTYAYDTLGNLTQVNQGVQSRTFNYSSLGRLLSATNPESGTVSYSYTDSGDLLARTDARGVITSNSYDGMHRILTKSYSGDNGLTPNVTYSYFDAGSSAPNIGQLKSMVSSAATVNYGSYDVLGRMGSNTQTTGGNLYTFQYSYRLNDSLSSVRYPSGKTVNFTTDDAGRVIQIKAGTKTYADLTASSTPFTADGRIAQMKLGNDLWETRNYQTPGTPTLFRLGTTAGGNDKLELEYNYLATANNGNLATQVIRQPGHTWTQNYTYDALNRISTASEANGFNRTYGYDQYGNRWIASSSGITAYEPHEPTAGSLFNPANNQLANQSYDAAGNQTGYAPRTLAYDAENRMISATSALNGNEYFVYDGDGRRVRKTWIPNGGSSQVTTYVYGPGGQLAAEYTNQISAATGTSWMFTDILGSIRAVTGDKPQSGAATITECYDYLPFGRMLSSADNGRNTGCYPASPDFALSSVESSKFTGKTRDPEMGLDFFGARFYSAAQGRFTSPDRLFADQHGADPQSWNIYAYVGNNPMRFVDTNGQWKTAIHNAIIDGAFLNMSPSNIITMQAASRRVDNVEGQLSVNAYKHGMRAHYQSKADARSKADSFILDHETDAQIIAIFDGGVSNAALDEFGMALHTITDRLAPGHKGEQLWTGIGEPDVATALGGIPGLTANAIIDGVRAIAHGHSEATLSLEQYHEGVDEARSAFLQTFGQDEFEKATGCKKVSGCKYDDSQLPYELRTKK